MSYVTGPTQHLKSLIVRGKKQTQTGVVRMNEYDFHHTMTIDDQT